MRRWPFAGFFQLIARWRASRRFAVVGLVLPLLALQTALALQIDSPSSELLDYVVQPGDTLSAIALANGVGVTELVAWNDLSDPDVLQVGHRLRIGSSRAGTALITTADYVVQSGDTLSAIARAAGVTQRDLIAWNPIDDPDVIAAGQVLRTSGAIATRPRAAVRQSFGAVIGPTVSKTPSKHSWPGRPYGDPIAIVLHTAAGSLEGMDAWFLNEESDHSAHFGIGLDGRVHQYVDLKDRAWANGAIEAGSTWPGPSSINPNHITISIETEDFGNALQPVTEEQYRATLAAARIAIKHYPKIQYLVTHRAISPVTRGMDPGTRWIRSGRFAALAADLGLEPIP